MSMKWVPTSLSQKGYTLIELLLYISIVGALLGSVSLYFGVVVSARIKNQTIAEVDQQGTLVMEYLTQSVRNANSISAPAPTVAAARLTLDMPSPALTPMTFNLAGSVATQLGYIIDGTSNDSDNNNVINSSKFVAAATGTVSVLYARIGTPVDAAPNNKGQMAIYSGATPTTRLANSADVALTAGTWNAFPIPTVAVTSGQTYWLAYNSNGLNVNANTLRIHPGSVGQSRFFVQTYNTWPASYTGTNEDFEYSSYAMIETNNATGAMQVREGLAAGALATLTNTKVQLSGVTFTNVTRAGTPGVVQISFTLSRVNPNNMNEYDYQKTFTTTAGIKP